jgi:hypothetical protein
MLDDERGSVYEPTAQQSVDDTQLTLVRELIDVGKRLLVSTIVQALPSHFSITPCVEEENDCGWASPTAQQLDGEVHATPVKLVP